MLDNDRRVGFLFEPIPFLCKCVTFFETIYLSSSSAVVVVDVVVVVVEHESVKNHFKTILDLIIQRLR